MFAKLVDLVLPPTCYGCGNHSDHRSPLCWRCVERLEPVGFVNGSLLSPPAAEVHDVAVYCGWRFDQDGPLARVIHALKYHNRPWLGTALGRALGETMTSHGLAAPDTVVPVPLYRLKELERGYNQAEWIGEALAKATGSGLRSKMLRRTVPTETQTRLSREERWINVRDAFELGDAPQSQSILIVDDVITTGATIHAIIRLFREAGYTNVCAAAVALSSR